MSGYSAGGGEPRRVIEARRVLPQLIKPVRLGSARTDGGDRVARRPLSADASAEGPPARTVSHGNGSVINASKKRPLPLLSN